MIDLEKTKNILHYDQETGIFRWAVGRGGFAMAGSIAGSTDSKGYRQIKISGRLILAHRLAWAYVYGSLPRLHIDHIDRNPQNNAIANLRLCTHAQNHQNKSMQSNNTSGHMGVSWYKRDQKWQAHIALNRKQINLGYFTDLNEAIAARKAGEQKYHTFQHA